MADIGWVTGGIVLSMFFVIIFAGFSVHNARFGNNINCPLDADALEEALYSNATNIFVQFSLSVGLIFTPCSGLPFWVTFLIFIPLIVGVAVWLVPFVGQ